MKYPVLLMAVPLLVSLVVSETLLSNSARDAVSEAIRERRAAAPPAAVHQPAAENINYRPYSQVPSNIKQLLQFQQAREPIHHIAAQPPPQLAKAPSAARAQYNPQIQYGAAQSQAQSHSQGNYQPQQSPQYNQQNQPTSYNPQQQYHGNQQQQQAPGNVFHPEQQRRY